MKSIRIKIGPILAVAMLCLFVQNTKAQSGCACDNDGDGKADSAYGTTTYNSSKTISAHFSFDGKTLTATSVKNALSNIVVVYADGTTYKYDNLSGLSKTITSSQEILGVWIHAGKNLTKDCPGCGEWFSNLDVLGCGCNTTWYDDDGDGKTDSLYGVTEKNTSNTVFANFDSSSRKVSITSSRYLVSKVVVVYADNTTGTYYNVDLRKKSFTSTQEIKGVYVTTGSGTTDYFANSIYINEVPVKLFRFSALRESSGVLLDWATASEMNNSRFDVEKSRNGKEFIKIGELAGHGTSNEIHTYRFEDKYAEQGTIYYRLRQVDFNGQYEYSPIAVVRGSNQETKLDMKLYPNPLSNTSEATLEITSADAGSIEITVFDLAGNIVYYTLNDLSNGGQVQKLDVSGLSNGLYFVKATIGAESMTLKLQVSR